ncbi:hypothetical protein ABIA00_000356 [Bradyrhizobium ottawaense]
MGVAEAIRTMVSNNIPTSRHHGAAKHGNALLAGMIRCRRCGRKLTLRYTGAKHGIPRYSCSRAWMDNGEPRCIAFGGLRVDDSISRKRFSAWWGPAPSQPRSPPRGRPVNGAMHYAHPHLVHWIGGIHSQIRLPKRRRGPTQ